jgi:hypothetical protein
MKREVGYCAWSIAVAITFLTVLLGLVTTQHPGPYDEAKCMGMVIRDLKLRDARDQRAVCAYIEAVLNMEQKPVMISRSTLPFDLCRTIYASLPTSPAAQYLRILADGAQC